MAFIHFQSFHLHGVKNSLAKSQYTRVRRKATDVVTCDLQLKQITSLYPRISESCAGVYKKTQAPDGPSSRDLLVKMDVSPLTNKVYMGTLTNKTSQPTFIKWPCSLPYNGETTQLIKDQIPYNAKKLVSLYLIISVKPTIRSHSYNFKSWNMFQGLTEEEIIFPSLKNVKGLNFFLNFKLNLTPKSC